MTPERWQRVKDVFGRVVERPAAERVVALDAACAGDAELRADVEHLLRGHDEAEAEGFIEAPAPVDPGVTLGGLGLTGVVPAGAPLFGDRAVDAGDPEAGDADAVGRVVGPYRLVAHLGRGGMGTVFRAERVDDPARRAVALKLVSRWDDGEWARARFRDESRILAALDHPCVARFIDAGTTPAGRPYLVMDLVDGLPLGEYARRHAPSVAERVRLFRQVCAAVQYLHQNLVVHRDLKPGNILVTADGTPRLLDFGIARLLEAGPGGAAPTVTLLRPLTPDYASPEQVSGAPVTTASDVYSLGAVLYELLTGQRPHRFASLTPADVARAVCTDLPPRPSEAVARLAAGATPGGTAPTLTPVARPGRLRRQLEGDLDTIVMTALRKEPERRYRSVDQLSEDLRRHLEGLPVLARPDTFTYRFSKFVGRNPATSAASVLLAVSIAGGVAATAWQAHVAGRERARAERRFADVRALAKSVLFEVHDAVRGLPGSAKARALIVARSREYLDRLARDAGDDPALRRELAAAYAKVEQAQRDLAAESATAPQATPTP